MVARVVSTWGLDSISLNIGGHNTYFRSVAASRRVWRSGCGWEMPATSLLTRWTSDIGGHNTYSRSLAAGPGVRRFGCGSEMPVVRRDSPPLHAR